MVTTDWPLDKKDGTAIQTIMICFASDNWAGAHPDIMSGLAQNAVGFAAAYGGSDLDQAVKARFSEIFERDVAVLFVATGTAANALSLTVCNRPGGISFCHSEAHIREDEFGAVEYFTGGSRICPIGGKDGKIDPDALLSAIERLKGPSSRTGRPMAVSLTQATEVGTVYDLGEIRRITEIANAHKLPVHMDGARFANALVALDVTPAEMTWKSGIDLLSFGGTKNGCWCAEAVIAFDPDLGEELGFLRHRAGQLFSKSRFVAAQFDAYFNNGLWLETARHANAMAAKLAQMMTDSKSLRLAWPAQANEVFAVIKQDRANALRAEDVIFGPWQRPADFAGDLAEDEQIYRFVTSFATTSADLDAFACLIGQ